MSKKSSLDLLDSLAPFYENIWAPLGMLISARKRYSSILKEASNFLNCENILDVGAGTGKLSDYVNSSYLALELSEKFLKVMKKKRKRRDAIRADAQYLPFKNQCFDGVAMMFFLHLIQDKHGFLRDLKRVMRKDGKLVLTVLCKGSRIGNLLSKWWKVQTLEDEEYLELLSETGFKVIESKRFGSWLFVKCSL